MECQARMSGRGIRTGTSALVLGLCAVLGTSALAVPPRRTRSRPTSVQADARYQAGMALYAAGDPLTALKSFRAALREDPEDPYVRAAVRRIEAELAAASAPSSAPPPPETSMLEAAADAFDALCLVAIPRAVNFDDSVGGAQDVEGTLAALNGRVAQLLQERRYASEHDLPFRKDRELRALVRRIPSVAV